MIHRKKYVVSFLFVLFSFVLPTNGQNVQEGKTGYYLCCEKEIKTIISVGSYDNFSKEQILVIVDASPRGKTNLIAESNYCPPNGYPSCLPGIRTTLSEKLLKSFLNDELMSVLAHELGHTTNQKDKGKHTLEDEYYADSFAREILGKLGMDKEAIIRSIEKFKKDNPSVSKEDLDKAEKRIERLNSLRAEENKK